MIRDDAFRWIAAVGDEFDAAAAALALATRRLREQPREPDRELRAVEPSHITRCADRLEATYIVRLFAEFEATLRDYWSTRRRSAPAMEILIDRIAALTIAPADWTRDTHAVRDCRNAIVHHRTLTPVLTFGQCRSVLARFVSMLPVRW